MNACDLVIEFLNEHGFSIKEWANWDGDDYRCYKPIPKKHRIATLKIYDSGRIILYGPIGQFFFFNVMISDPESFNIILKSFNELYLWLDKNIGTGKGRFNHESQGLCSRDYR